MAAGLLLFALSVIGFVQNQVWLETLRGRNDLQSKGVSFGNHRAETNRHSEISSPIRPDD